MFTCWESSLGDRAPYHLTSRLKQAARIIILILHLREMHKVGDNYDNVKGRRVRVLAKAVLGTTRPRPASLPARQLAVDVDVVGCLLDRSASSLGGRAMTKQVLMMTANWHLPPRMARYKSAWRMRRRLRRGKRFFILRRSCYFFVCATEGCLNCPHGWQGNRLTASHNKKKTWAGASE